MPSAAAFAHTASQHVRETAQCFARGATLADRFRLARDTVRFHLANRLGGHPDFNASDGYDVTIAGRRLTLTLRRGAGDFFVFHEVFTGDSYALPSSIAARTRTVVDLGAHVGLTSLYFLELLPQARVVCLEPTPDNAAVLSRNLAAFGDRATIIQAAIAAQTGAARFQSAGWSWERRLGADANPSDAGSNFEVACVTVDEVMRRAGLETIDLLKVDVEGAEQAIFADSSAWLDRVGAIIIELHEPYSVEQFAAAIRPAGFQVRMPSPTSGNQMIMAVRDPL